jgi:ribosomal protein S18 acetylase RimI-like enzyme
MASLSNFFRPRDPIPPGPAECRPVQRHEIEAALRLILADDHGLASDSAVLDFLGFAMQRKIDVNQIWVAAKGNRIYWALLPITSPGRTMLLFTPHRLPQGTDPQTAQRLTTAVCDHWGNEGMQLAQFLLDPADQAITQLYESCGFEVLAELIYLQRGLRSSPPPGFPAGFGTICYEPSRHRLFANTILESYQGSLDCPALNGKRDIEDVIAGHRATGIFDPNCWFLLLEHQSPCGVLILSPSQHNDSVELVYLGLCPQARHRGLADGMMHLAMHTAAQQGRTELTLAVDAHNTPALRLYFRHGLKRIGSRLALLREIRPQTAPIAV